MEHNFVIFDDKSDFYQRALDDVKNNAQIKTVFSIEPNDGVLSKILWFLYRAFCKILGKPRHRNYYNFNIKPLRFNKGLPESKTLCFVMTRDWYASVKNTLFIKRLRKKYKGCVIVLLTRDVITYLPDWDGEKSAKKLQETFDFIFSVILKDCLDYGFLYAGTFLSKLPISDSSNEYDVVYFGSAKNRLCEIQMIYKRLTEVGANSRFYVYGVPIETRSNDGIIYANNQIPYTDLVGTCARSRCLILFSNYANLELPEIPVVIGSEYAGEIRYMEAIMYNKKFLTNGSLFTKSKYFDSRYSKHFGCAEDINADFVCSDDKPEYVYNDEFSPVKWFLDLDHFLLENGK